jgi:hypothetical protein
MAKDKRPIVDMLTDALHKVSEGYTYAEAAVRLGIPYWVISGNIRKVAVPMLWEEKDKVTEYAEAIGTTAPELIMDMVNFYWDDYVKRHGKK